MRASDQPEVRRILPRITSGGRIGDWVPNLGGKLEGVASNFKHASTNHVGTHPRRRAQQILRRFITTKNSRKMGDKFDALKRNNSPGSPRKAFPASFWRRPRKNTSVPIQELDRKGNLRARFRKICRVQPAFPRRLGPIRSGKPSRSSSP